MIDQYNQDSSEESMLGTLGTAFDGVRLDRGADEVMARGRVLRRRKRAVPALAVAGIAAVSLSLALATQPSGGKPLAYHGTVVNMDNAAFSVHTDAKTGTVTVTARELIDPKLLEAVLAKAGVRADIQVRLVGTGILTIRPCTYTGVTELDVPGVITGPYKVDGAESITVHPAAMPAGSVLDFQYYYAPGDSSSHGPSVMSNQLLSGMPTGDTPSGCVTSAG